MAVLDYAGANRVLDALQTKGFDISGDAINVAVFAKNKTVTNEIYQRILDDIAKDPSMLQQGHLVVKTGATSYLLSATLAELVSQPLNYRKEIFEEGEREPTGNDLGLSVTNISPVSGNAGTTVVITGQGYQHISVNGVTKNVTVVDVDVAGVVCASWSVNSNTQITATIAANPSLPNGQARVIVQDASGNQYVVTGGPIFYYQSAPGPPTFDHCAPNPIHSGTSLWIYGSHFNSPPLRAKAHFSKSGATDYDVDLIVQDDGTCVALVPSDAAQRGTGTWTVTINNSYGSVSFPVTISPDPGPPHISSFSPSTPPQGQAITVKGSNFQNPQVTKVTFSRDGYTTIKPKFSVLDDNTLIVIQPFDINGTTLMATGPWGMTVTNSKGDDAKSVTIGPFDPSLSASVGQAKLSSGRIAFGAATLTFSPYTPPVVKVATGLIGVAALGIMLMDHAHDQDYSTYLPIDPLKPWKTKPIQSGEDFVPLDSSSKPPFYVPGTTKTITTGIWKANGTTYVRDLEKIRRDSLVATAKAEAYSRVRYKKGSHQLVDAWLSPPRYSKALNVVYTRFIVVPLPVSGIDAELVSGILGITLGRTLWPADKSYQYPLRFGPGTFRGCYPHFLDFYLAFPVEWGGSGGLKNTWVATAAGSLVIKYAGEELPWPINLRTESGGIATSALDPLVQEPILSSGGEGPCP